MNLSLFLLLLAALLDPDRQKLIEIYESQFDALRSQIPGKLRFTPAQKLRMARAAHALGRKAMKGITTLVTPDTLFRWYREAVRAKWDYSKKRGPGRPKTKAEIEKFILIDCQNLRKIGACPGLNLPKPIGRPWWAPTSSLGKSLLLSA